MKAVVMSDLGVEVKEVERPDLDDNSALVRIVAAGICGTDLAIISGNLRVPMPLVLGHELTGDVVEVGRNVKTIGTGSKVTSEINLTCGQCFFCRNGIPTHCTDRKALGIDVNGAFAEYAAVPAKNLHILPESITYEEGVFVEPLAAAIQTLRMSPLKPRGSFVVIGDGRLGQLIVQAIKANYPNSRLLLLGKHDSKLEMAKKLASVDETVNVVREDPVKAVMNKTGSVGADIVIEATGNPDIFSLAFDLVRHRGTIALKSTHGQPVPVDVTQIAVRELTLQGSRCGPFNEAIGMMKSGKVKVKPLISARYSLGEAKEAFQVARKPETLKVLLKPGI